MEQHPNAPDSPARESGATLNIVTIPCHCPKDRHEFDTVTLHQEVPLDLGIAAAYVIEGATDQALTIGRLSKVFLTFGIAGWSLTDADGKPERITEDTIAERLPYSKGGYEVTERANALYVSSVMRPLLAARQKSSQAGQTAPSTPPTTDSGRKRPKHSAPSSPPNSEGSTET